MSSLDDASPQHAARPAVPHQHLQEVARHVASGKCILFLGAGVHSPPDDPKLLERYQYTAKDAPPRGKALSIHLAKTCGYDEEFPEEDFDHLQRMSMAFQQRKGRPALAQEITDQVSNGKRPSPVLNALARMPFRIVITTNYDRLFEKALTRAEKEYEHCIYSRDENHPTPDLPGDIPSPSRPFVLKIHGDIQHRDSLVVTDEDYIHFILRMGDKPSVNPVPLGVRNFMRWWPTLFVGYSLNDYNLRLLFKTLRWGVDRASFPTSYSVDPWPDPLLVRVFGEGAEPQIFFITQDVWTFVPALHGLLYGGEEMPL